MSRFYALELFAPGVEDLSVKVPPLPPLVTKHIYYNTTPTKVWTSHPNGIYDPGAQNIEFVVMFAFVTSLSVTTMDPSLLW